VKVIFMRKIFLVGPVIGLALAGCNAHTPIVAVAADDIGVVAAATPQAQGVSLTVGYKGAKFAVLPVENRRGEILAMRTKNGFDTYSVFTQLGLDAKAGASGGAVGVEQVLAVGPAADAWVNRPNVGRPMPLPPATPGGQ
jgi:hypothetical protein